MKRSQMEASYFSSLADMSSGSITAMQGLLTPDILEEEVRQLEIPFPSHNGVPHSTCFDLRYPEIQTYLTRHRYTQNLALPLSLVISSMYQSPTFG